MRATGLAVAAALMLGLVAACEDGDVEAQPKDSVKVGSSAFASTRDEMTELIGTALSSAVRAAGGQKVRRSSGIKSSVCDAIYPRRFQVLEASSAFVVPGSDRPTTAANVRDAWLGEGWKPELGGEEVAGETDEVTATKKAASGVSLTIRAVVLGSDEQAVVNIDVLTPCLELDQKSLDSLEEEALDQ